MQFQTVLCYNYTYNMIFKSKHKLQTALGSPPLPPVKF